MSRKYPLADQVLTPEQFLAFLSGSEGRPIDWQQVQGITAEDRRQLEAVGSRPYLFADGVHMMTNPEEYPA